MDTSRDEHFSNIGRIVSNFQSLEFSIKILIWYLLGVNFNSIRIITSQISFNRLCTTLQGLFRDKIKDEKLNIALDDILVRASQSEEKRNLAVHSTILVTWHPEEWKFIRYKTKYKRNRGLKKLYEDLPAENLYVDAMFILDTSDDLRALTSRLFEPDVFIK